MYDVEKITKIIKDIEKEFAELEGFGLNEKTITDSKVLYASSMALFVITSRAIDLAEDIIVKNEFGMPASYKEYFRVLYDHGIIGKEVSAELQKLTDDRNLFAHEYFNVRRNEVLEMKKRIDVVKIFIDAIKNRVRKELEEKNEK